MKKTESCDTDADNRLGKGLLSPNDKSDGDREKILQGLKIVWQKLLEFKKAKNSEIVVLRDNKIVRIKPK